MSTQLPSPAAPAAPLPADAAGWRGRLGAVIAVELRRQWLAPGAIAVYALAALPMLACLGVAIARAIVHAHGLHTGMRTGGMSTSRVFSGIFDGLTLRTAIFFGCAWMFIRLFRAESDAKSLHYALLTPVSRPVLVWGKYFAAWIGTAILFAVSTLVSLALVTSQAFPAAHAAAYAGIAILACAAYGAVFLILGLLFRNPVFPVLIFFGWEAILLFLPPWLQRLSVLFYLHSLLPVPLLSGTIAVVAAPASTAGAIASLIVIAAVLTFLSARQAERMEIAYAKQE
ncbi:MAG: ABC-2 transporter permease [Terriglobales bacterium]